MSDAFWINAQIGYTFRTPKTIKKNANPSLHVHLSWNKSVKREKFEDECNGLAIIW